MINNKKPQTKKHLKLSVIPNVEKNLIKTSVSKMKKKILSIFRKKKLRFLVCLFTLTRPFP